MNTYSTIHTLDTEIAVDTSAYADGDVVGGLLDLNALVGAGGGGLITKILLADDDAESAVFKLYLFGGEPTTVADNAAFASAMTAADLGLIVDVIDIASGDYVTINSNVYALVKDLKILHGSGELYGYLVLNGSTPTFTASTDLTLTLTGFVS